jgi:hypothetical protein
MAVSCHHQIWGCLMTNYTGFPRACTDHGKFCRHSVAKAGKACPPEKLPTIMTESSGEK